MAFFGKTDWASLLGRACYSLGLNDALVQLARGAYLEVVSVGCQAWIDYGQAGGTLHVVCGSEVCTQLRVTLRAADGGGKEACITYGAFQIPSSVQPPPEDPPVPPIGLTVDGQDWEEESVLYMPFDPDTEQLVLCIESKGGDAEADPPVPLGQIVSVDIQAHPAGDLPANTACVSAEYDDEDPPTQTTAPANGTSYLRYFEVRDGKEFQAWCGPHQLVHCGGCSYGLAPF